MPVPSSISDLSQTESSNSPAGSESPITTDNYLRTYAAFIATLRDGKGFTDPVTLASATTTDIGAQNSLFVEITGTNTITGFGTTYEGPRFLRFTGVLTLTHNATTLNLPGSANIATEAGDTCIAIPNSTTNGWNVVHYMRKDLAPGASDSIASGATSTTQSANDNSTKIATTAYSDRASRQNIFNVDASVAGNALTLTINAQYIAFRSATQTDGTPVIREVASPITLTISSGSTLGTTSAVQSEIAIIAIDNAGTVEVAAVNTSGGTALSTFGVITTTAEGGAGAADSATTIYSTTARTDVAYEVVGFVRSTQATAGTWATAPSLVQGLVNSAGINMPLTLGTTANTTSGTSVDVTGIPPGVKRVTLMFNGVSTNGSSIVLMQLGSGSAVATGYLGTSTSMGLSGMATTNYTTGFGLGATGQTGAATVRHGAMVFSHMGSNIWTCQGYVGESNSTSGALTAGSISVGGQLDRIRLTTVNGTDAFDAGSVNVLYE